MIMNLIRNPQACRLVRKLTTQPSAPLKCDASLNTRQIKSSRYLARQAEIRRIRTKVAATAVISAVMCLYHLIRFDLYAWLG
jgi:hypothetical protein